MKEDYTAFLIGFNLIAAAVLTLFAVLAWADTPFDAANALKNQRGGDRLFFAGMVFWLGFCITYSGRKAP